MRGNRRYAGRERGVMERGRWYCGEERVLEDVMERGRWYCGDRKGVRGCDGERKRLTLDLSTA